ncbi:MAG: hypothetical protein QF535_18695 [Anaerolineales bacterium]|jgi:hypothetical protein|nr:hypothetical protein [Anaerolineales bacterium]
MAITSWIAAGGDNFEYGLGQNGPGYTTVSGFALGYNNWYSNCGNGGSGTWSWSEPVCPTQNPDSPSSYGGYHGDHYRNLGLICLSNGKGLWI